jgi:transcriptional regulator with XRE-family HTH domain
MQYKSNKTLHLNKIFGAEISELRKKNFKNKSRLQFCYEYDLDAGNLSRIENGVIDTKLSMLWRLSEALDIPLSEIFKKIEKKLGKNFRLLDE